MPLGTEVGLGPVYIVRWGPSTPLPTERGTTAHPLFWPMSIVAKRLLISATAELVVNKAYSQSYSKLGCSPKGTTR